MREAPTIVLIGAGSTSFGLSTLHDLYVDPVFDGAHRLARRPRPAPLERMQRLAAALEAATGRGITVRAAPTAPTRSRAPTRWSCRSRSTATDGGSRTSRSRAATVSSTCSARTPVRAGSRTRCARSRSSPRSPATSSGWRRRAADQLHESRGPDLHRVPPASRSADHRPVPRGRAGPPPLLGPPRTTDRVPRRGLNHLTALVAAVM